MDSLSSEMAHKSKNTGGLPAFLHRSGHPNEEDQRLRLKAALVFVVILVLAFCKPLVSLMLYARGSDLHSHIVLVPLVSAYLLVISRHRLPREPGTSPGLGIALALTGLGCLGLALYLRVAGRMLSVNDQHVLPTLAFLSLTAAGGFFFLGRKWMAAAAFPFVFLLFMMPLPDGVVHVLETASQYASAEAASWFYSIAGVPFLRDELNGNLFALPGIQLQVAQECSGIRSSWVLLITSTVAAFMFLKGPWRRILLVALVIPLGVLRNGFRILVIGWLCVERGPHMANHWIHHQGGPVFFVLSLIPFFLILWLLRRGESRKAVRMSKAVSD